jgi:hypothetical protein
MSFSIKNTAAMARRLFKPKPVEEELWLSLPPPCFPPEDSPHARASYAMQQQVGLYGCEFKEARHYLRCTGRWRAMVRDGRFADIKAAWETLKRRQRDAQGRRKRAVRDAQVRRECAIREYERQKRADARKFQREVARRRRGRHWDDTDGAVKKAAKKALRAITAKAKALAKRTTTS